MEWNIFSDWKWDWEIQVGYCNGLSLSAQGLPIEDAVVGFFAGDINPAAALQYGTLDQARHFGHQFDGLRRRGQHFCCVPASSLRQLVPRLLSKGFKTPFSNHNGCW